MNKKVRILALALAVAVALVGAGYAAWGTEITSTTKMHSGEWKIVLENDSDASYWAGDQIGTFEREEALSGAYGDTTWSALDRTYDPAPSGQQGVVSGANYVYVMAPVPVFLMELIRQLRQTLPNALSSFSTCIRERGRSQDSKSEMTARFLPKLVM